MRVRFGYVAIALDVSNASPNRTTTVKMLERLPYDVWTLKLRQLAEENLRNQLRILKYNAAYDIHVFRFTSKLVPLVTHEVASGWDYISELADGFRTIGEYTRKHNFRTSFHPDHFVNLTALQPKVLAASTAILDAHDAQCRAMGFSDEVKLNIHMGGAYSDKMSAHQRFLEQFATLSQEVQRRITLENDDKTFTVAETLHCAQQVGVPMVLDIHHHRCNPGTLNSLEPVLVDIFSSWHQTGLPPKIHASSPRGYENATALRSHADFLAADDLLPFLQLARRYTDKLDVMIEAKSKDIALKALMQVMEKHPEVTVIDGGTIEI